MKFKKEELIKSPLNYVGGKYKLLPQLLPFIPDNTNIFVDLFAGGLDISINVQANKVISNDIITPIIDLYKSFKDLTVDEIINGIDINIHTYNLSKDNNDGFLELRKQYNDSKNPIDLITLISYCYNNQIRFNSSWGFNRAFGKNRSHFNDLMKDNLIKTIHRIQSMDIEFVNLDYLNFDFSSLNSNDFVYADPPYLITNADYSIQARWDEEKEKELLNILDELNDKGVKFALSNVLEHDGKSNDILKEWSKKYNTHYLNHTYKNANADKINKKGKSIEVLITNYKIIN